MNKNLYSANISNSVPVPSQIRKHKALDESAQELSQTIQSSHEILVKATTVFPFTLFPDTVTLDRAKLTITHRDFFWTGEIMSIRIEDILNVAVDTGPFFGSLKIFTRFFSTEKPYSVNFLYKRDALRIKRILQGYVIALQNNISCITLPTNELAEMLNDLGK